MLFKEAMLAEDFDAFAGRVERDLRAHKGKYIFQGTIFIAAGILAAAFPPPRHSMSN